MKLMTIASAGETARLIISEATMDQCQGLQEVCNDWDDKELLEGENFKPDYIYTCLTEGDLPPLPDACRDLYSIKSIYTRETRELIGFIEMYHGYPEPTILWVSMFVIRKDFRGKGYAQEVIYYINSQGRSSGFSKTGIGVFANNLRALKFWTKAGFSFISSNSNNEKLTNNVIQHLHFTYANFTFDVRN